MNGAASNERWQRLLRHFDILSELPDEERAAAVARLAWEESDIADELERMLLADSAKDGVLDGDVLGLAGVEPALAPPPPPDRSGERIAAFELLERLGRGGMGEVYRGRREGADFQQELAIKLLRSDFDRQELIARFVRERQIQARLQHPGIARLIDAGVHEGTPWLAMELIRGEPLVAFADKHALDLPARLQLIEQVAVAVDYAHRQLIVHRDIKPSNVLVDESGQPHLLDFGIAKLLDPGEATELTGTDMRVMSPMYAAPEQIAGDTITTATDVYALGLLLYELLTGTLPHGRREGRSSDSLEQTVAPSACTQGAIAKRLKGDLDTIVLTALAVEPERRYPSALALADDLQHFRLGRPIRARPDTLSYRLGKFVRRHRGSVAAAMIALIAVFAGLGIALWQASVAREQATVARQEAQRADRVRSFLISLFVEKEGTTRSSARERSPLELIGDGIARAKSELSADPELLASVLGDLLDIQVNLGGGDAAMPELEALISSLRQQDPDSERLASLLASQITVLFQKGKFADAKPMIDEALRIYRKRYPDDHVRIADMQNRQVRVLIAESRDRDALALMQSVVAAYEKHRGPGDADLGIRYSNLAVLQQRTGDLAGARQSLQKALSNIEKARGTDHAQLLFPLTSLGDLQRREGDFSGALATYQRALSITQKQLGDDHFQTAGAWGRVGDAQRRLRRFAEAEASLRRALEIAERTQQNDLADIYGYLGQLAIDAGRGEDAVMWFERAHQKSLATQGERQRLTWAHLQNAGEAMAFLGQTAKARQLLTLANEKLSTLGDSARRDAAAGRFTLAVIERNAGNLDAAIDLMLDADAELRSLLPEGDARITLVTAHLAVAYALRGSPADRETARRLLADIADSLKTASVVAKAHAALAKSELATDQAQKAAALDELDAMLPLLGVDGKWLANQRSRLSR